MSTLLSIATGLTLNLLPAAPVEWVGPEAPRTAPQQDPAPSERSRRLHRRSRRFGGSSSSSRGFSALTPEPATLTLLGLAGAGLWYSTRKRKPEDKAS